MSSILLDVKHKVGPSGDYEYYNLDIKDAVNEAFAVLTQLGVGGEEGFQVESEETGWDEVTTNKVLQNLIKSYVYKKVQLIFDPPNNGVLLDNIKDQVREREWRILTWIETNGVV